MKLEKAIEIKEKYHPMVQRLGIPGLYEADKLSIEALKDLVKFDAIRGKEARLLLPGETEE